VEAGAIRRGVAREGRARFAGHGLLPPLVAVGTAITVVVGLAAAAAGVELGAALPPFVASWEPRVHGLALPAVAVMGAAVILAPRLLAPSVSARAFAGTAFGLALVGRLAVAMARGGPTGPYAVFDTSVEAKNEYLPALPALDYGPVWFLDRFAELVPSLPVHVAGHPPGLLLLMHLLGIDSAPGLGALTIAAAALSVPLTYVLAHQLLADDTRARVAALLAAFAPAALLHGASSADALYASLGLLAAIALVARRRAALPLGAGLLAVASFFSWALLAVGAWAAIVVARRDGVGRSALLAAACAGALGVLYGALYAGFGFDPLGTLAATEEVYHFSLARLRPYAFWLFGSPAAFLVVLGLPVAWYAVRALAARQTVALALAAVIVTSAVLGFTKAETERIWLFLVPLACIAAATVLPRAAVRPVLALIVTQALAAELLLDTIW